MSYDRNDTFGDIGSCLMTAPWDRPSLCPDQVNRGFHQKETSGLGSG